MSTTAEIEKRAFAKVAVRLLPLLTIAYILNYLDRNNIGFAALTMNRAVGLTATQFGTGAGILFLGYSTFEVPSNMALYRFGARRWIARIMITWGIISTATIFVSGPKSWYAMRLLLGIAEAGFFPGVIYYLSNWFPNEYRTRMLAWFIIGIPASSLVGGPISGLLLGMNGVLGISGWKWLFILEGVPAIGVGFAALWLLTDSPEQAKWLTPEERDAIRARMLSEQKKGKAKELLWQALKDPRVIVLAILQLGFTAGSYGIGIWLPQILKTGHLSNINIGLIIGGCYALASIAMILWSIHVDRTGKKVFNLTITCLLGAAGLLAAIYFGNFWVSLAWITIAVIGITAARAIFWAIPPEFLTGMAAAGGLAFINSIGTLGGFLGPFTVGWLKDRTHSFSAGLLAMAVCLGVATVLSFSLKFLVPQE